MAYEALWDNDAHTIVRHKLIGRWTNADYIDGMNEVHALMNSVPHTVHVIVDMTEAITQPLQLLNMTQAVEESVPSNQGCVIGVKINSYLKSIVRFASRVAPKATKDIFFADTVKEAHDIIAKCESSPK